MEFLEGCDFTLQYHPREANVVADALSRKTHGLVASLKVRKWKLLQALGEFELCLEDLGDRIALCNLVARPTIVQKVLETQLEDPKLGEIQSKLVVGEVLEGWQLSGDGAVRFLTRLCVPDVHSLREEILDQDHRSRFAIHPGCTKMYRDLKRQFWWRGLKRDVAEYVARYYTC